MSDLNEKLLTAAVEPPSTAASRAPALFSLEFRLADACLAGLGLFCGVAALRVAEVLTSVPLFAPPMLASAIIFSVAHAPPNPKGFIVGTAAAASVALLVFSALSTIADPIIAQGGAAGTLLLCYKMTSTVFPPIVALIGTLSTATVAASGGAYSYAAALRFLLFPWLAGHAWLYFWANVVAWLRAKARVSMAVHALVAVEHDQTDAMLRAVYDRFDTSGDGFLDAHELKVALRAALGIDLVVSDVQSLVAAADKHGAGVVDFEHFLSICRGHI